MGMTLRNPILVLSTRFHGLEFRGGDTRCRRVLAEILEGELQQAWKPLSWMGALRTTSAIMSMRKESAVVVIALILDRDVMRGRLSCDG
jgi:hypothetical protein